MINDGISIAKGWLFHTVLDKKTTPCGNYYSFLSNLNFGAALITSRSSWDQELFIINN